MASRMTAQQKRILDAIALILEGHAASEDNVECVITFNGSMDDTYNSSMGNDFKKTKCNATETY